MIPASLPPDQAAQVLTGQCIEVQTEGGGVDDRPEIGPDPGLGNGPLDATTTETEETTEETTIETYGIVRAPVQSVGTERHHLRPQLEVGFLHRLLSP